MLLFIYDPYHSTYFNISLWVFPHASSQPYTVTPVLLTVGVIFSPKSPCGLKSNLSDFTYDGLKQVSVFKALKVMWEKWIACTDHHLVFSPVLPVCGLKCTIQRHVIVMIFKQAQWSAFLKKMCMKMDDFTLCFCAFFVPFFFFCNDTWSSTFPNSCDLACKSLILYSNISKGKGKLCFQSLWLIETVATFAAFILTEKLSFSCPSNHMCSFLLHWK